MASVEEVITELKRLRLEQVDEIARIIHDLKKDACEETPVGRAVATRMVERAVRNGSPAEPFAGLIGSVPEFERSAQPPLGSPVDW